MQKAIDAAVLKGCWRVFNKYHYSFEGLLEALDHLHRQLQKIVAGQQNIHSLSKRTRSDVLVKINCAATANLAAGVKPLLTSDEKFIS